MAGQGNPWLQGHPVDAYVGMLRSKGFISPVEQERLQTAIEPLMRRFPRVTTVEQVRLELAPPGATVDSLARLEAASWRAAAEPLIPGFDLEEARSAFFVTMDTDTARTVRFLRPALRRDIGPYVPSWLGNGEVFFFLVLRMFRRQHELETRARPT